MCPVQERRTAPPLIVAATAAAVVVVDQLTKTWALHHVATRTIHLVWTLRLNLTFNSGGAFSLGRGSPWFFVITGGIMLVALALFGRRLTTTVTAIALGLVLGGALGNLGDRVFRDTGGAVIDFIDLQWWPVFNVADAALSIGAVLLVLTGLTGQEPT